MPIEPPLESRLTRLSLDPALNSYRNSSSSLASSGGPNIPSRGPRSSRSSAGTAFNEANPTAEYESYSARPQKYPSAIPNISRRGRYNPSRPAQTGPPGRSSRTPSSPNITHGTVSAKAQPLDSMTQNQTQASSSASPDEDGGEDSETAIREA